MINYKEILEIETELSDDIINIICQKIYQIEHSEKMLKNLKIINFFGNCNSCEVCKQQNPVLLIKIINKMIKKQKWLLDDLKYWFCELGNPCLINMPIFTDDIIIV